jgi:hypothetical protein
MKLVGDEQQVQAQIDEWTVDVMRDVLKARARGPGTVFKIGSELFEVVQGGDVRPVAGKGGHRSPRRGAV